MLSSQKKSLKKDASAVPVNSAPFIWERFEESLELDAPVETNAASTDQPSFKEAV